MWHKFDGKGKRGGLNAVNGLIDFIFSQMFDDLGTPQTHRGYPQMLGSVSHVTHFETPLERRAMLIFLPNSFLSLH